MPNRFILVKIVIYAVLLLFAEMFCMGQSKHEENGIYRSLVDKEARDGTYLKALAEFGLYPYRPDHPPCRSS